MENFQQADRGYKVVQNMKSNNNYTMKRSAHGGVSSKYSQAVIQCEEGISITHSQAVN